jgi:hypothetical protein
MKELERRLRALEAGNDPAACLDCEMRSLALALGLPIGDGDCTHPRKDLPRFIMELDAELAKG